MKNRTLVPLLVLIALSVTATPALASEGLGVIGSFGKEVNKTKVEEKEKGAPITEAEENNCTTASGDTCQAGKAGSGPGEMSLVFANHPEEPGSGVAVNSAGDVYVADTANNRVEWFSPAGKYEGQFDGSGKLTNEGGKQAPEALSKPEGIAVDDAISSPSKDDVYVIDSSQGVVDKFSSMGEFIGQLNVGIGVVGIAVDSSGDVWVRMGSGPATNTLVQEFSDAIENKPVTSPVAFPAESGNHIAVDSQENVYLTTATTEVKKFSKTATEELGTVCTECGRGGLAVDPANNDLFTDQGSLIEQFGPFGEPFEAPLLKSEPGTVPGETEHAGAGIALSPANHEAYVADGEDNDVIVFADGPAPEAPTTLAATIVKGNSAVLHGELKPPSGEAKVDYYFEYNVGSSCAGGTRTPIEVKEGASESEVSEEATGLEPREEYTYCLVAKSPYGIAQGNEEHFPTPAAAPMIVSEGASYSYDGEIEEYAYRFDAKINPNHSPGETTYFFEYSTTGSVETNTLGGTIKRKAGVGTLPAEAFTPEGEEAESDTALLGMTETYYFRVVASSECEPGVECKEVGKVQAYTKAPQVENENATILSLTAESVSAELDPDFQASKYGVEYATGPKAKELLEKNEGTHVAGTTEIPANEKTLLAHCADGNLPTFSNGSFTCSDSGPQPTCEDGATPTARGESLVCRFPVSIVIENLQPLTSYYYRVTGENESTEKIGQPADGEIKQFTTPSLPFVDSTATATNITATSATLSGSVTPLLVNATYYFQYIGDTHYREALARGLSDPYEEGETTSPVSIGASSTPQIVGPVQANNLLPGETYHYRLVAGNQYGTRFGEENEPEHTFTTRAATPPVVSTGPASAISQNSATLSGTVTTNGLQTNYGFEIATEPNNYGPATGLGTIGGAASETVSVTLSKLQPGTTYYYRITATNADGTEKGEPQTFTTPAFPNLLAPLASLPLVATPNIAFPKEEKGTTTPKALTNKQKLANALRACRKTKNKTRRRTCEKRARGKYGTVKRST
jgi:hypothetical protein